ncbi:serine protease [Alistipes onderdonkii]|jgi:serine protease Do|nr:serine protease [Alistipes onderdonkii]KAA2439954.1 serine protease [Alistipes onderdonkii]
MKAIHLFIVGILILSGCAQKPKAPNRKYNHLANKVQSTNIKPHQHIEVAKPSSTSELTPSEIFERYSPAVFKIHTSTGYQGFQGSGFFISNDGLAVSNYHVFRGTTVGYETIILSDGSTYKVTDVYYKDSENDFIIFRVGINHKISYIKIANITPRIGEKVYTIGSPRGLDNTFSSGEISQIRDNGNILQISAPIDHGSSGGVLLNSYGEAIGITSGGIDDSGANLNYAINIKIIKPYIPKQ